MNTLYDIERLATELINTTFTFKANGITQVMNCGEQGQYKFKFDQAKRRLGCCKYTKKLITLSKPLCIENLDKVYGKLTDTILHEIAHALSYQLYGSEGRGHGSKWRSIAKQIGCDGKRCYSHNDVKSVKAKYTLTCPTCEIESPRHRKPKYAYACGKCCNGSYNVKHEFVVKQNY
jgi:predicted SprT family Zn-dependent metalloprotease